MAKDSHYAIILCLKLHPKLVVKSHPSCVIILLKTVHISQFYRSVFSTFEEVNQFSFNISRILCFITWKLLGSWMSHLIPILLTENFVYILLIPSTSPQKFLKLIFYLLIRQNQYYETLGCISESSCIKVTVCGIWLPNITQTRFVTPNTTMTNTNTHRCNFSAKCGPEFSYTLYC